MEDADLCLITNITGNEVNEVKLDGGAADICHQAHTRLVFPVDI